MSNKKYFYISDGKGVLIKYEDKIMLTFTLVAIFFVFPLILLCSLVFIFEISLFFLYMLAFFYAIFLFYARFTRNKVNPLLDRKVFDPIENKMYVMQINGNELCVYVGNPIYINMRSGYMAMWTAELVGSNNKIYLATTYSKEELEDFISPFAQWLNIPFKYDSF